MATQPKKRKAEEDPDQQWNCCCCGGVAMRPTPAERATLKYKCGAGCGGEACTNCAEDIVATPHVGRCKLDPSLKAPCFQPLHLRVVLYVSTTFNLNPTLRALHPLHRGNGDRGVPRQRPLSVVAVLRLPRRGR